MADMPQTGPMLVPSNWIREHRRALLIAGPAVLIASAAIFYWLSGRYVSTDDAYIEAARVEISTNISARVSEVDVRDNQYVHAGQVLFKLDPSRFRIALENAEAQLAGARQNIRSLRSAYRQQLADEKAASDTLAYRQRDYARAQRLAKSGIASQAQLDQARHDLQTARQALDATTQKVASALAALNDNPDAPMDSQPSVRQALAALADARLSLSYTVVRAPIAGIVARVDQLQRGDYVDAAKPLFALISRSDIWVRANFKETDMTHMRPGQPATITVDAYPNRTFSGKVESLSPGTGSSFSLLPPENASGNWVKVVQRLPVRVSVDSRGRDVPLAAGMSAEVEVDTGSHHGFSF